MYIDPLYEAAKAAYNKSVQVQARRYFVTGEGDIENFENARAWIQELYIEMICAAMNAYHEAESADKDSGKVLI